MRSTLEAWAKHRGQIDHADGLINCGRLQSGDLVLAERLAHDFQDAPNLPASRICLHPRYITTVPFYLRTQQIKYNEYQQVRRTAEYHQSTLSTLPNVDP